MSEDKKYFWLKLKRDFFKRHDIEIIESMPNGEKYVLFYLKLLTESIDHEGRLRFSDTIPYKDTMLATITKTDIDVVRSAIKIFTELKMMEIFDDDTLYMSQIEDMLGSATVWAEKKRIYRENQKQIEDMTGTIGGQKEDMSDKSKRLDIEKDIELDKDSEIKKDSSVEEVLSEQFIALYKRIQECSGFKQSLYKVNSPEKPIKWAYFAQKMLMYLLEGTFIEKGKVKVGNCDPSWLDNMTEDRIVAICSKKKNVTITLAEYLQSSHGAHIGASYFFEDSKNVPSNCNPTIPAVTMQKDVTIPKKIMDQFNRIKAFPRISKSLNDKKLQSNLIFLDNWWQNNYPIIKDYNQKYVGSYCGSFETIVDCLLNIMEGWEGKIFDESFFEYGKWGWNTYLKECTKAGVDIEIFDKMLERRKLDKEIAESNRKLRERNALREEAGLPPQVIPTADGKLPYEIENERLAAIKAGKRQVELDERKRKEDEIREQVKQGGTII